MPLALSRIHRFSVRWIDNIYILITLSLTGSMAVQGGSAVATVCLSLRSCERAWRARLHRSTRRPLLRVGLIAPVASAFARCLWRTYDCP